MRKHGQEEVRKVPEAGETQCIFTPDPGEVEGPVHCGVCGEVMDVKRGCNGPTSSIMAMGGSKRDYDFFSCSLRGELWHKQVSKLRDMARSTASSKLRAMFLEESQEILKSRQATVENGGWSFGVN